MQKQCIISTGADGGPRSWVGTSATLRLAPHRHQEKFELHLSAKFHNSKTIFENPPFVQSNIA